MNVGDAILLAVDHLTATDNPDYWVRHIKQLAERHGVNLAEQGISDTDLEELRIAAHTTRALNAIERMREGGFPHNWDRTVQEVIAETPVTLRMLGMNEASYAELVRAAWERDSIDFAGKLQQRASDGSSVREEDLKEVLGALRNAKRTSDIFPEPLRTWWNSIATTTR